MTPDDTPDGLEKLCDQAEKPRTCGHVRILNGCSGCGTNFAIGVAKARLDELGFSSPARARRHAKLQRGNATLWEALEGWNALAYDCQAETCKKARVVHLRDGVTEVRDKARAALKATEGDPG